MNLADQSNNILLKLFYESDIPTLSRLCKTNRHFAQLCQDQNLWKNKYLEFFGEPTTTVQNWKEAFYDTIGINKQAYVIKLITVGNDYYARVTVKNIAVMEAHDINSIYDKLAALLNNNIKGNPKLYNALKSNLDYHNNRGEKLPIKLPVSGGELKYIIDYVPVTASPRIDINGPLPLFLSY